jgi:Ca2+-dependent lipid-binding protein
VLCHEYDGFDVPYAEDENFDIVVDGETVHPVFIKNQHELKVQYDFTLCNTKLRLLTFSLYKDAGRLEFMLKSGENINHSV